jgi:hypothetical protein
MAWLISKALMNSLCSQEQEVESLGENFSDGEQSAPLSGKPTQQAYCALDKMTDFSRLSQSGMTFKPLTESRGEELLMSYLEGFLAKTCHQREEEPDLKEQDQDSGEKWRGWLAKFDPDMCLWRTPQCSLITDSEECLETYPASGLMRDGLLWEQTRLVLNTTETEYGLLPTPTARDFNGHTITKKRPKGFNKVLPNVFKLEFQLHGQCYPHPTFSEGLMLWPIGWTDLKPLVMDKSHCVQQQPSES